MLIYIKRLVIDNPVVTTSANIPLYFILRHFTEDILSYALVIISLLLIVNLARLNLRVKMVVIGCFIFILNLIFLSEDLSFRKMSVHFNPGLIKLLIDLYHESPRSVLENTSVWEVFILFSLILIALSPVFILFYLDKKKISAIVNPKLSKFLNLVISLILLSSAILTITINSKSVFQSSILQIVGASIYDYYKDSHLYKNIPKDKTTLKKNFEEIIYTKGRIPEKAFFIEKPKKKLSSMPNIIFISLETAPYNVFSLDSEHMPYLKKLAEKSLVFERH